MVLAVLFLHISLLPIIVGAFVEIDSDRRFAALEVRLMFLPVFVKRMSFDEIKENIEHNRKIKSQARTAKRSVTRIPKYLKKFGTALLGRIRVQNITVRADIGIPDAAVCACVCAAVDIAYAQACAFFSIPYVKQNVRADYNAERFTGCADGIISVCFADIICAACLAAFDRRGKTRRSHENDNNIARRIQRAPDRTDNGQRVR